jgi:large conductance mechanosensitive channel
VFLSATLNFLIVAFILFLIVKGINSFKKKKEEAPAATPEEIILLREIRDQLKK